MEPTKGENNDSVNAKKGLTAGYVSPLRPTVDGKVVSEDHLHSSEPRKNRRISSDVDPSVDRSPLHPRPQTKSIGHGSSTPSRGSKQKSTVEVGTTVPKLFEWDENDPSSADNFTGIFEKVRDEKKHGMKPPMISVEPEFHYEQKRGNSSSDSGCFCVRWFRK
ncbi:RPM1-interacting protein 4-like isoform X2 [Wolffia australiana]